MGVVRVTIALLRSPNWVEPVHYFRQSIASPLIVIRSYPYSCRQFLAAAAGTLGAAALAGRSSPSQTAKTVTASYRSRPDLKATLISVTGPTGIPAAGYLFVTPSGPLIVDNVGEPIWITPVPHASTNFRVQRYRGQPVLSWWQGEIASYGSASRATMSSWTAATARSCG